MKTHRLNIGSNRGRARLWLQGALLLDAGLTRGTRYDVEYWQNAMPFAETAQVLIVKRKGGARKVAGRAQRGSVKDFPIIDINTRALDDLCRSGRRRFDVAEIMPEGSDPHHPDGLTIVLQSADLDKLTERKSV